MKKKILLIGVILIGLIGGLYFVGAYYFDFIRSEPEDIIAENSYKGQTQDLDGDKGQEEGKEGEIEVIDPKIEVGKEAPDFTLLNTRGEEVSLSDFRGKYLIVNFWGIWCHWCDLEMPDLQRIHDENENLVVLAVNVMEETDEVVEYVDENGYSFPVVLDSHGQVARTYLINGFPTSYFIDKDGILLGGIASYMDYEKINKILDSIREENES